MRLIILLSLISMSAFAEGFGSYQNYRENFNLLVSDISKLEARIQKNNSPVLTEMLKDMSFLKSQYDHLANPLKLEAFHQDAVDNKWFNLEKMSKELIPVCDSNSNKLAQCKSGLEQMKTFALNSKLSQDNKDSLVAFIDDYLSQMNAFAIVNQDFIDKFNKNVNAVNLNLKEDSAKLVKQAIVPVLIPSDTFVVTEAAPRHNNSEIIFFTFAVGILLVAGFFYNASKKNKLIKGFYSKIFTLAKKNNLHLKVFGNLSKNQSKLIELIQMPFLNAVYLSRGVSSRAQIKFRNKTHNVSIEVNYATSRSIQNVMMLPKEKGLKESLETLQATVEAAGGEFVFSNRFNSIGELVQSSVILHLPKV